MRWLSRTLFLPEGEPDQRVAAAKAATAVGGMVLCLSLAVAFSMSSLYGNDERAHLGYVEALLDGDLPTVDTPIEAGPGFELLGETYADDHWATEARGDIWVANHPPLAHLLAVPPVWLLRELGSGWATAMVLRVLSSVLMALGVVAAASVADALAPGRPLRAVLVAAVVGLTPMVVSVGGLGQSDGAGFAVGTVLLAVILRITRSGASLQRLAWLVALGGVAALTRVSLLPLIGVGALAWLVACRRQPALAVLGAVLMLVVPALAAAWFYARNLDLYGDLTGASHLQDKFDRLPEGSTLELLMRPQLWAGVWQEMWGSFDYARIGTGGLTVRSSEPDIGSRLVIGGLIAAAAVIGGVRRAAGGMQNVGRADVVTWSIGLGWLAACILGVAWFSSGGGTPHPRYLLPAHAVTAALVVGGITAVAPLRVAWPTMVASLLAIDLLLLVLLRDAVATRSTPSALLLPGWMAVATVVAVLGAIGGAIAALHHATQAMDRDLVPSG